ncbi:MAG: energy-coupling factor transporter transmembrane protein EcfT [Ruminococcus sp.]|nr:energy-coupling factor transporter transmembrane protein EcfT [Ruminococcus sp.]
MSEDTWTSSKKKSLLDPRTKLLLIFVEAVLVLATTGGEHLFWFRVVFAMLPFLLLLTAKRYKTCFIGLLVLGVIYFLEYTVFPYVNGAIAGILLIIIMIINRFLPAYLMGVYVMGSTTVSEFKAAMDKLYVPDALTIPMCVMFRLFPTIKEENDSIRAAMKMRGIRFCGRKAGKMLEYRVVPMITCTAKIGEELSASALTRGLGKEKKRTNICHIGFGWADIVIFLLVAATLVYWILGVFA